MKTTPHTYQTEISGSKLFDSVCVEDIAGEDFGSLGLVRARATIKEASPFDKLVSALELTVQGPASPNSMRLILPVIHNESTDFKPLLTRSGLASFIDGDEIKTVYYSFRSRQRAVLQGALRTALFSPPIILQ